MTPQYKTTSARATQLRLRCEAQREQLAAEFAEIEARFQSVDSVLLSIRNVVIKPGFIVGTLAMMVLGRRRITWFSKLRKGLFWFTAARRAYQMFKNR